MTQLSLCKGNPPVTRVVSPLAPRKHNLILLSMASDSPTLPSDTASLRVLIVEDDTLVGLGLKSTVTRLGHRVTALASTSQEASAAFAADPPDLVLLDLRLGSSLQGEAEGLQLAHDLSAVQRTPIIVITAYSDPELIRLASDAGVFAYLVKPVTPETLAAQIQIALTRAREAETLRSENASLTDALETRKLVEKAKGILMQRLGLPEPEAHRHLQLESQKRRIPLKELATKVIESNDLLTP